MKRIEAEVLRSRPTHPINKIRRENREMKEENGFLHGWLLAAELLAAAFCGAFLAAAEAVGWI